MDPSNPHGKASPASVPGEAPTLSKFDQAVLALRDVGGGVAPMETEVSGSTQPSSQAGSEAPTVRPRKRRRLDSSGSTEPIRDEQESDDETDGVRFTQEEGTDLDGIETTFVCFYDEI
jgi:hypothetical protein